MYDGDAGLYLYRGWFTVCIPAGLTGLCNNYVMTPKLVQDVW